MTRFVEWLLDEEGTPVVLIGVLTLFVFGAAVCGVLGVGT